MAVGQLCMYKPDKSMHWIRTSGLCVTAWRLSSTLLPQPRFRKVRVANTDARLGAGCQGHVSRRCLLEKAQVRADRWHILYQRHKTAGWEQPSKERRTSALCPRTAMTYLSVYLSVFLSVILLLRSVVSTNTVELLTVLKNERHTGGVLLQTLHPQELFCYIRHYQTVLGSLSKFCI